MGERRGGRQLVERVGGDLPVDRGRIICMGIVLGRARHDLPGAVIGEAERP